MVCEQIEVFLREKVKELNRNGIIFGLSGGLDSTVIAYQKSHLNLGF